MTVSSTPQDKAVVHYKALTHCEIGERAVVLPTDHPNRSNTNFVRTSEVHAYDKASGVFETRNTRYIPLPDATRPED